MPTLPVRSTAVSDADQQDVMQLREALQVADHAYRRYLAELGQGDVEPAEDWSTWFAEYLLGFR